MLDSFVRLTNSKNFDFEQGQFLSLAQRKALLEELRNDLRPEHRRRIEIMLLADMGYSQAQI